MKVLFNLWHHRPDPHGGQLFIYHLAHLMTMTGLVEARVGQDQDPTWIEPEHRAFRIADPTWGEDAIQIVPEVDYEGHGVPICQGPRCLGRVIQWLPPKAIVVGPMIAGALYQALPDCEILYAPIFIFRDQFPETPKTGEVVGIDFVHGAGKAEVAPVPYRRLRGSHAEVIAGMLSASAFYYPVINTGLDYPVVEAMAAGCHVITGANVGSLGFVRHGINATIGAWDGKVDPVLGIRARGHILRFHEAGAVMPEVKALIRSLDGKSS